jgi:hypothetical protein
MPTTISSSVARDEIVTLRLEVRRRSLPMARSVTLVHVHE